VAEPVKVNTQGSPGLSPVIPSTKPVAKPVAYGQTAVNGVFQMSDALRISRKQDRVRWYRVASGSADVPVPDQGFQRAVIIAVTNTGSTRTVTIPTEDISREGAIFIIKDESGGANSNNITVATEASETIDGASSVAITADHGVVRLYSNGTHLFTW